MTAPVPPLPLPPGAIVSVPGRGEFFVRDTGGTGPVVLLLHGWMFPSDLNWLRQYAPLRAAGYRVLAMDLRGHGRGLRSSAAFRLIDCADDADAVLATLEVERALVVGYSMGGPVAQLLAVQHPARVAGLVLCATAMDWRDRRQRVFWRTMSLLRLGMGLAPRRWWTTAVRAGGGAADPHAAWAVAELSRGSAVDLAEAGRELGRFDSSRWVAGIAAPVVVVVTRRDRLVPPAKQYALARASGAAVHPVDARPRRLLHVPGVHRSAADGARLARPHRPVGLSSAEQLCRGSGSPRWLGVGGRSSGRRELEQLVAGHHPSPAQRARRPAAQQLQLGRQL